MRQILLTVLYFVSMNGGILSIDGLFHIEATHIEAQYIAKRAGDTKSVTSDKARNM